LTLVHAYFALATLVGLLWFVAGMRCIYRRRVAVFRYRRDGWAALAFGVFTVIAGSFVLNYGIVNFLHGPANILKGLLMIGLFVLLLQAAGYALAEIIHAIVVRYQQRQQRLSQKRSRRGRSRRDKSRRAKARRKPTR